MPPTQHSADVTIQLRRDTEDAHRMIEVDMDIARAAIDRPARIALLVRLHGFHRVWEPAIATILDDPGFLAPRRRLTLLREDLQAEGLSLRDMDRLPVCRAANALAASQVDAWASLYVMEGSTLGGQVIARRFAEAGGKAPAYFDPYGASTGAMWRETRSRLRRELPPYDAARAVASANRTFRTLHGWLRPAFARAA